MTRRKKNGKKKAYQEITSSRPDHFSNDIVPYQPQRRPLMPEPVALPEIPLQQNALYRFWAFHRIMPCGHIARVPDILVIYRACPVCHCALEDNDIKVSLHLLIRHGTTSYTINFGSICKMLLVFVLIVFVLIVFVAYAIGQRVTYM